MKTHTNPYFLAALLLSGCASLPYEQGVMPTAPQLSSGSRAHAGIAPRYESEGMVNAADFIPAALMHTDLYSIDPQAYNDGEMNTYRITTPDHAFVIRGTSRVLITIGEIKAIAKLEEISTLGTMANSVKERTFNLVETPARAAGGIYKRFGAAKKVNDKIMTPTNTITELSSGFTDGALELTNTGKRIATSAGGTKCSNVGGCLDKAGSEIWSGVNSFLGKHNASRELHAAMGTDYYTDNKVLRREVSRLAYADSYISTAVKFGFTMSGVPILDPLATGVGYYNNGEFVIGYQDGYKERNREKAIIQSWGVDEKTVNALYSNKAYSHTGRKILFTTVSQISTPAYRVKLIEQAATVTSRSDGDNQIKIFAHLAKLQHQGQIKTYIKNLDAILAIGPDDRLILPFAADYLRLTASTETMLHQYARLAKSSPNYRGADIHMLGHASPKFTQTANALGIQIKPYNLMTGI